MARPGRGGSSGASEARGLLVSHVGARASGGEGRRPRPGVGGRARGARSAPGELRAAGERRARLACPVLPAARPPARPPGPHAPRARAPRPRARPPVRARLLARGSPGRPARAPTGPGAPAGEGGPRAARAPHPFWRQTSAPSRSQPATPRPTPAGGLGLALRRGQRLTACEPDDLFHS